MSTALHTRPREGQSALVVEAWWRLGEGASTSTQRPPHGSLQGSKNKFQPGDKVVINKSHGFKHWHGDEGVIDKLVPIGKYYVNMDNGDRRIVDMGDLDPA
jgi:hypothetical protein